MAIQYRWVGTRTPKAHRFLGDYGCTIFNYIFENSLEDFECQHRGMMIV